MLQQPPVDLIHSDIPGYQNFVRMPPAFFDLIKECIHHRIEKSVTNFRKPLEVGLILAITVRHLATGKNYTSLQYHWLVGGITICKFVNQVEYLHYSDSPDDWKRVDEKFRIRWNAVGAIGGKHIAIKKPKKSGSDYYKYKGFYSLVLLALVQNTNKSG